MTDLVRTEHTDGVTTVAFHRPDRHNALNDALFAAWRAAVADALASPDTRCLLLLGDGPSFSSGRDTSELGHRAAGESDHDFIADAQQANKTLLAASVPIVAGLHGHVVGGAAEIALSADIRIAAESTQIVLPEVRFGLIPDTGATALLTRLVGPSRAKLMILGVERVDAATANDWGLVDRVVADEDLVELATELARRLAAAPPLAVQHAKRLVDECDHDDVTRAFDGELAAQVALFRSDDHREAKTALAEGRTPDFRGA